MNVAHENSAGYLENVGESLAGDGCEIRTERIGDQPVLVGYRSEFLPQMLAKLHLFTAVAVASEVTGRTVDEFARQVGEYGLRRKGALRGVQSGVAIFAVLVSDNVAPDAVARAERTPRVRFAVRVQPVIVDLAAGSIITSRRGPFWGFAMNGFLRRKLNRYLPEPSFR